MRIFTVRSHARLQISFHFHFFHSLFCFLPSRLCYDHLRTTVVKLPPQVLAFQLNHGVILSCQVGISRLHRQVRRRRGFFKWQTNGVMNHVSKLLFPVSNWKETRLLSKHGTSCEVWGTGRYKVVISHPLNLRRRLLVKLFYSDISKHFILTT